MEKLKGWCTTLNLKNTQNILVSPWQHAKNNHKCTLNNQNTPTTFKKQVECLSYNWSEPKLPNNHMKQNRFSEHLYNCIATHTHTHPHTQLTHPLTHTDTHTHTHTKHLVLQPHNRFNNTWSTITPEQLHSNTQKILLECSCNSMATWKKTLSNP